MIIKSILIKNYKSIKHLETLAPFVDAYRFIKEKDCERLIKITSHGEQK